MENEANIIGDALKLERKIRNKEKRKIKQDAKRRERELLHNKQDQTISQEFYDNYQTNKTKVAPQFILETNLNDLVKINVPHIKIEKNEVPHYSGNNLDGSLPVRFTGKHSEHPKDKRLSKLKKTIIEDISNCISSKLINYETNVINDELNGNVITFLNEIVVLQEKLFKRDPLKGVIKRRYVVGFNQVKKYLVLNKIKIFVIAIDIKITTKDDILYKTIRELRQLGDTKNIPYIFALKRRKIGQIALKYIPLSCIGVLNYDSANESFQILIRNLEACKNLYKVEAELSKLLSD